MLDFLAIRTAGLRRYLETVHESFKSMQAVRGPQRIDKLKPPASDWIYLVECSSKECDNAEFGDTPEEAARLWNFANPDLGRERAGLASLASYSGTLMTR